MTEVEPTLISADAARQLTRIARHGVVKRVLDRYSPARMMPQRAVNKIVDDILDMIEMVPVIQPDRCEDRFDHWGQCERTYGHPPFIISQRLRPGDEYGNTWWRNDEGEEILTPSGRTGWMPIWDDFEDHEHGGHYSLDYNDPRRPSGTHPWDY